MITDRMAQRIASEWHSGGGSALYALASTGAINNLTEEELIREYADSTLDQADELDALFEYVRSHGSRGPVPGWYESTIAAER